MKKLIVAAVAALTIGGAVLSSPAEARCFWNGFGYTCTHHFYRPFVRPYYGGGWCAYHPWRC